MKKVQQQKKTLVLNNIINIEQIILPNPTPVLLFWFESTALKVLGRFGKWKKQKTHEALLCRKTFCHQTGQKNCRQGSSLVLRLQSRCNPPRPVRGTNEMRDNAMKMFQNVLPKCWCSFHVFRVYLFIFFGVLRDLCALLTKYRCILRRKKGNKKTETTKGCSCTFNKCALDGATAICNNSPFFQ